MDKLILLISSVEAAVRYLLSGAVIAAIWVLSVNNPRPIAQWALSNQVATALCVVLIGFTAFSIYRLILWVVGDAIAWKFKASAPAEYREKGISYARPYAEFLRWRHSEDLPQSLSGYLTYRWSVAHFAVVSGLAGLIAALCGESNSILANFRYLVLLASLVIATFGCIQISFLYRVERELCRDRRPPKRSTSLTRRSTGRVQTTARVG